MIFIEDLPSFALNHKRSFCPLLVSLNLHFIESASLQDVFCITLLRECSSYMQHALSNGIWRISWLILIHAHANFYIRHCIFMVTLEARTLKCWHVLQLYQNILYSGRQWMSFASLDKIFGMAMKCFPECSSIIVES